MEGSMKVQDLIEQLMAHPLDAEVEVVLNNSQFVQIPENAVNILACTLNMMTGESDDSKRGVVVISLKTD
jgi:hypothetical protein